MQERIEKIAEILWPDETRPVPDSAKELAHQIYNFVLQELSKGMMSDGEIRQKMKQAMDEAQEYGDDGEPLPEKVVVREQRIRDQAEKDAQLSADRKEFIRIVKGVENPYWDENAGGRRVADEGWREFEACREAILKEVE